MFPHQEGAREAGAWGAVAGYYGGYSGLAGSEGWYGWGSPPSGRPASEWGPTGYSTHPDPGPAQEEPRPEARSPPGQRLGINTNIYSLYQGGGQARQPAAGQEAAGEVRDTVAASPGAAAVEPDSSTPDPPSPRGPPARGAGPGPDKFGLEERLRPPPPLGAKLPSSGETCLPPALKKKQFSNSILEQFGDMVKEQGRHSFPLSVEINEVDSSLECVASPPLLSPSRRPALSPRKRGRKPKHYSEILFELGQRGISITKTRPGEADPRPSHKTGGQQLKCPHCNKILTTSVGLMYHIRLHTGEKPYSCEMCGKSFATSSHYHYHIRSHSGEKPYRCDFCGKMYTASGSLRLHLKSHLSRLAANAFNTINTFPADEPTRDPLQPDCLAVKLEVEEEEVQGRPEGLEGGAGGAMGEALHQTCSDSQH